ncbi:MAG TPA: prolyl oligopeptidase family serine peptidase, partial [Actinomycetota bacterium]|nr:prolyl oligopeptidase family serine peptidase [Actinomycetota bacterium]
MRPVGFEEGTRYPLLLNIHGGPFTQYGNRFFDEFQIYAGAGYAVAYANPRGSSGYSESWGRAIRGPVEGGPGWGSVDYEDLMAVVDEAIKRFDFVDPDRLGVMGAIGRPALLIELVLQPSDPPGGPLLLVLLLVCG